MKKILCLFTALSTVLISSCSSDDSENETNVILPKTVNYIYSNEPGDNDLSTIVYNGNKIVSTIYSGGDKEVYTYAGSVITKIEDIAKEGNISSKNEFTYENGKLKIDLLTEISKEKTYISKNVYTHNANGTISFITYSVDPVTKKEEKSSEGVLTYLNGNLINKTETYSGNTYNKTYEYDSKNSPRKNILGFNLLVDFDTSASINNVTKSTNVYKYGENTTTSVLNTVYEYNEKGYPVKQTETDSFKNEETTIYTY